MYEAIPLKIEIFSTFFSCFLDLATDPIIQPPDLKARFTFRLEGGMGGWVWPHKGEVGWEGPM